MARTREDRLAAVVSDYEYRHAKDSRNDERQGCDCDLCVAARYALAGTKFEEAAPESEIVRPPLTRAEARELFSLWLAAGMHPPEIDPRHPLYTGAQKLAAVQPRGEGDG